MIDGPIRALFELQGVEKRQIEIEYQTDKTVTDSSFFSHSHVAFHMSLYYN